MASSLPISKGLHANARAASCGSRLFFREASSAVFRDFHAMTGTTFYMYGLGLHDTIEREMFQNCAKNISNLTSKRHLAHHLHYNIKWGRCPLTPQQTLRQRPKRARDRLAEIAEGLCRLPVGRALGVSLPALSPGAVLEQYFFRLPLCCWSRCSRQPA